MDDTGSSKPIGRVNLQSKNGFSCVGAQHGSIGVRKSLEEGPMSPQLTR